MFETQGGTRNRTRDLPKKGSAFILSSDHWTLNAGVPRVTMAPLMLQQILTQFVFYLRCRLLFSLAPVCPPATGPILSSPCTTNLAVCPLTPGSP